MPLRAGASRFLAAHDAPLYPLEPGANKHLFQEVSLTELEERCCALLVKLKDAQPPSARAVQDGVAKLLGWLKLRGKIQLLVSSHVEVAFVVNGHTFLPVQPLTRAPARPRSDRPARTR